MSNRLVRNLARILFPTYGRTFNLASQYQPQQHLDTTYLLKYHHPEVAEAIKENKYTRHPQATAELATIADRYFKRFESTTFTIIPIPQSKRRQRERGFHHLEEVLSKSTYSNYVRTDILKKVTHTKQQAHVDKKSRLTQQVNTFACEARETKVLRGVIILFDDVLTTGATIKAARTALVAHMHPEVKLISVALAH